MDARAILEQAVAELPPPATAQHQQAVQFSPDFVTFVKSLENERRAFYEPEASVDGGAETIGYGHKIKRGENFGRITEREAARLLLQDLATARQAVDAYIKDVYGVQVQLSQKQAEMLTEFAFNLGSLNKFPKFTDAVLREDWTKAAKEYRRSYVNASGVRLPLEGRNRKFAARYGF
jgi:GH24 family phage-related lysozyme (muramidase)